LSVIFDREMDELVAKIKERFETARLVAQSR